MTLAPWTGPGPGTSTHPPTVGGGARSSPRSTRGRCHRRHRVAPGSSRPHSTLEGRETGSPMRSAWGAEPRGPRGDLTAAGTAPPASRRPREDGHGGNAARREASLPATSPTSCRPAKIAGRRSADDDGRIVARGRVWDDPLPLGRITSSRSTGCSRDESASQVPTIPGAVSGSEKVSSPARKFRGPPLTAPRASVGRLASGARDEG